MKIKWETGSNSTGKVRHEDCCDLKAAGAILWIPAIPVLHTMWDLVSDRKKIKKIKIYPLAKTIYIFASLTPVKWLLSGIHISLY